jgi:homeobox protein cut-like
LVDPRFQLTPRVKALETQITELEAEASRLLRALDSLKEAKAEQERESSKKAEEATKEISTLTAEIDGLKSRVKQFGDYDEIKRELEIMKVGPFMAPVACIRLMPVRRVLRRRLRCR